jgi:Fe-S-cluster-containing dehydrogenase component
MIYLVCVIVVCIDQTKCIELKSCETACNGLIDNIISAEKRLRQEVTCSRARHYVVDQAIDSITLPQDLSADRWKQAGWYVSSSRVW